LPVTGYQLPVVGSGEKRKLHMKYFTKLFTELDQTTKTLGKIKALIEYFEKASDQDKLWAIAILSHRRPKRTVNASYLAQWANELSGLPEWLFYESHAVVGDLAETITLVLPSEFEESDFTLTYWIDFIKSLEPLEVPQKKEQILWAWQRLSEIERFVFNKLITGGFRIGVSQQLMVKALAKHADVKENIVAHRLMGNWSPDLNTFQELLFSKDETDFSKPYPFYLAYAIEDDVETLGDSSAWIAERKWDGIRGQIIVRNGQLFVWSRGEELVTDKYPEYQVMLKLLPEGTVIDGEILPFKNDMPMSFNFLQTRIGRKTLSPKLLKEVQVAFVAYDVLEWKGEDIRTWRFEDRRKKLEEICSVHSDVLRLSPRVEFNTWEALADERKKSRDHLSEGIMLKRKDSIYRNGRRRGDWWKWKIDPFTVDAVMIYAMRGHGRRANLYTDYTFAVWDGEQLVPFTKAYSGLTDEEIKEVDRWVKQNTLERFGPVRSVKQELVFEIAFEGINRSSRHKSGIALRFPRMARWRKDKVAREANTLSDLNALLKFSESHVS
jgi:DNA ligase-1